MEKPLLSLKGLSFIRAGEFLLDSVNFELFCGETHAIVGTHAFDLDYFLDALTSRNGSYKGQYYCNGTSVGNTQKNITRETMGVITSKNYLIKEFSVLENIYFTNKRFYSNEKKTLVKQLEQLFEQMDINIDPMKPVGFLSKEERKLVEVIRWYLESPKISVLYETINFISDKHIKILQYFINKMKAVGKGIIYITSKYEDALRISDRISILRDKTILGSYQTDEVRKNPKEFVYSLFGWNGFSDEDMDPDSKDMLNSIIKASDIITSSYELKSVIRTIAEDIKKIIGVQDCSIYLVNDNNQEVIDSTDEGKTDINTYSKIRGLIAEVQQQTGIMYFYDDNAKYSELFANGIKTIVGVPILVGGKSIGVIQLFMAQRAICTEKELIYLATFNKEIAIAVETSRLTGRSILLQESHHRIKNNLQVIVNLIYMQKRHIREAQDLDMDDTMDTIIRRVKSIATVHDLLSSDQLGDSIMNLKDVIVEISKTYRVGDINIMLDLDNISIPYNKLVSISLVVNELISNSVKHAFLNQADKKIHVSCRSSSQSVTIEIQDNGKGLPADFCLDKADGTGMSIIKSVIRELGGTVNFVCDNGTKAIVVMNKNDIYML